MNELPSFYSMTDSKGTDVLLFLYSLCICMSKNLQWEL